MTRQRDRFLTPDSIPAGVRCRVIRIPDSVEWLALIMGALDELTDPENWERVGAVTTDEAANRALQMFFEVVDGRVCRVLGEVIMSVGAEAPDKSLLCDGSVYNRVDYPQLYDALDPALHLSADLFRVPDLQGRVPAGAGPSTWGTHTLADSAGFAVHVLSEAEMPTHTHTDLGHAHAYTAPSPGLAAILPDPVPLFVSAAGVLTLTSQANLTSTGSSHPHNNIQPTSFVNFYIVAFP